MVRLARLHMSVLFEKLTTSGSTQCFARLMSLSFRFSTLPVPLSSDVGSIV